MRNPSAVLTAREALRDQRGMPWLDDLARDLKHAVRLLRASPVFASTAVLSLALGIGANTAIFTLLDTVMFRPLPVRDPTRLVQLARHRPPYGRVTLSYPQYAAFRDGIPSFNGVLATAWLPQRDVVVDGQPDVVDIDLVSHNYYTVLGVDAALGRTLVASPDRPERSDPDAVLSDGYWRRRFNADPAVIGKTIQVRGAPFTIVGVTPPGFSGITAGRAADIALPIALDGVVRGTYSYLDRASHAWLFVIARVRDGRTLQQAQTELNTMLPGVNDVEAASVPAESDRKRIRAQTMTLRRAANGIDDLERRFGEPLVVLMAAVALLLLIACANLANLLLARSAARQPEIALRQALGASRTRLVRQLFSEGLLLAAIGGALGVALAYWGANGLVTMMSNGGPRLAVEIRPDSRMLLFATAVTIAASLLFGLAPAVRSAATLRDALSHPRTSRRWRSGSQLLAIQVAISMVLVIGAGLFARTLRHLSTFDAGFARDAVFVFQVNALKAGYSDERLRALQDRIIQEVSAIPGIASTALAEIPLLSGGGWDGDVLVEGRDAGSDQDARAHLNSVGVGYFATLGTPIVAGREFTNRDAIGTPPVAIVNQAFARFYFGDRSPVGRGIVLDGPQRQRFEIVGVAKDMKYQSLRQQIPRTVFFALRQAHTNKSAQNYIVRTHPGAASPVRTIAATVAGIDPALSATETRSMSEHIALTLLPERLLTALTASLGLLGLVLVSIGVYGVVAFEAARRTREVGIRLALGARPVQVVLLMLREMLAPVLAGTLVGLGVSLQLTGLAEKMLFGITPTDAVTFGGAGTTLILLAMLAGWLPSRRASRLNPAVTLRSE